MSSKDNIIKLVWNDWNREHIKKHKVKVSEVKQAYKNQFFVKGKGRFKMKRPKPIKPFKTLDEEANFWDTHDLSKIIKNPKTPLSELLSLEPKKDVVMTVRVQKAVKEKIENIARIKGVNSTTLSRMWLIDRLMKEDGGGNHAFV